MERSGVGRDGEVDTIFRRRRTRVVVVVTKRWRVKVRKLQSSVYPSQSIALSRCETFRLVLTSTTDESGGT